MYELTMAECQRRRKLISELHNELKVHLANDSKCECHTRAQAALPELIERLIAGDDLSIEPILAFYQSCIDAWARDIYNDPVYESHFKAEIAARFVQKCTQIESSSFCQQLKIISCEIADTHLKHIEEHQLHFLQPFNRIELSVMQDWEVVRTNS